MPLTIGEVTSELTVEPSPATDAPAKQRPLPSVAESWRLAELLRRALLESTRTQAAHGDD